MTTRALVLLALAFGCAACAPSQDSANPVSPPGLRDVRAEATGAELYKRDCAWCHGARGDGTQYGPDLVTDANGAAMTHFMLTTGRMPLEFPEQRMDRDTPTYSDEEIGEIVDYVTTFGQPGPEVPELDLRAADIQLGAELYQENCAACHSTSGIGGALASGGETELPEGQVEGAANIASNLRVASATEIAEAILVGPGTMPVFSYDTFNEHEIDSIVRYVLYLQEPNNRGGAGIGGAGPVAEGAVGWIIGLGLLLVFIRWLGTKTGER